PSHLMPTLIAQGLQGKLPPLVNPDIARDYVYVDDVNEAYILAATRATSERGVVYNVGTGIQVRLREVVEVACRVLGITAAPEWGSMPNRQWDSSVWIANNHKIQTELGWFPRYSFEQGFKSMTDWFQQHRPISA
ncbi:MAG: GDP-mannose 4,6-dehydratase, partial [Cyanobacteria bacterium P01_G01_bin.38]